MGAINYWENAVNEKHEDRHQHVPERRNKAQKEQAMSQGNNEYWGFFDDRSAPKNTSMARDASE